jgi:hypothetical protein
MVKIKLGQLATPAFMTAMQHLLGDKISIRGAWHVKELVAKFNQELARYQEMRKIILETHCKKGDDGKPLLDESKSYSFDKDVMPTVMKEMNELNAIEVEVNPITLSELGDACTLNAQQLIDLGDLIHA